MFILEESQLLEKAHGTLENNEKEEKVCVEKVEFKIVQQLVEFLD